ncbi:MAG TPA: N-formylglutamate amidohydrolase, partial [Rhodospirillaceae bacterium]|nr:N-formylglutamate amidohydrolase [Rhodospirillaceae bacterium]
LAETIDEVHNQFGEVWHINCHSMPAASGPGVLRRNGRARADFVLGDRDGSTCSRSFRNLIAETLEDMGYVVALNDPYKGVELVRAYSNPLHGRHSIQIEINRALYMNERTLERHPGFDALRADLDRLVSAVADFSVTRLPAAAE